MDSGQDRLLQFDRDLLSGKNICSSEGIFVNFPPSLKKPFQMKGLGLIICRQGNFQFSLNQKKHFAGAGESLFIPEDGEFQVLQESEDMEVRILIYQIEPIRDIMGNLVVSMYMYSRLTPEEPSCVWSTGEEEEIVKYMSLLDNVLQSEENSFKLYEQKLLLLALTYRICSIYNRKLVNDGREVGGRKNEVFIHLIQLIEKYYMQERGVEFYAVNRDYPEEEKNLNNHFSRKLKADVFIDDRNLGGLPDWGMIYEMINRKLTYEDLMRKYEYGSEPEKPKSFFARLFGK